jgi:hypothetical protein
MLESHGTRWLRVRPARSFRPIFFIFLIAGIFFIVPYMLLMPTQVCLRAAWRKRPLFAWRSAACISTAIALVITCPPSPFFVGLDGPIPLDLFPSESGYYPTFWSILKSQCFLINATLIAMIVCFPLSALSTLSTIRERRRLATTPRRHDDDR